MNPQLFSTSTKVDRLEGYLQAGDLGMLGSVDCRCFCFLTDVFFFIVELEDADIAALEEAAR